MTAAQDQTLDEAFEDVTALFEGDSKVPEPERTHTINVELANRVLDYIEANPEEHEQSSWATLVNLDQDEIDKIEETVTIDQAKTMALGTCNTAGCFAGWTAALSGHLVGTVGDLGGVILDLSPGITLEKREERWTDSTGVEHVDQWVQLDVTHDDRGEPIGQVDAQEWARDALGLNQHQANELFYGNNSRDRIRHLLSDWTEGEIARYSTAGKE